MACLDASPACRPAALCDGCLGRAIASGRGQARVLGECWAERVARRPEFRVRDSWPTDERTAGMARRKVAGLSADPRVADELAGACLRGAAAWWARRPERYR